MSLYAKHTGGERELASEETERESVSEAEHMIKREVAKINRFTLTFKLNANR